MSGKSTSRWIDVLPDIVRSYNGSYHRSIGMAPRAVTKADQDRIWTRLYGDGDTESKRSRIADGSMVRINRVKGLFEKGYMPNWVCVGYSYIITVMIMVTTHTEHGALHRGRP